MLTVSELEFLERLCDPFLSAEEAAFGVTLASDPDDAPPAYPPAVAAPAVDVSALAERLLAGMRLPDGDDGIPEGWL